MLTSIAANGATPFQIIMAMTLGPILPRKLFEHFLPSDDAARRYKNNPKGGCIRYWRPLYRNRRVYR